MSDEIQPGSDEIEPAKPAASPSKKKAKKKSRKKIAKKKPAARPAPESVEVPAVAEDPAVVQPWRSKTLLAGIAQILLGAADKVGNEPIFNGEEAPGWVLIGTGILTIVLRYLTSRPIA